MDTQHADNRLETSERQELNRLRGENTQLLDELTLMYQQFLSLKQETDISYDQLRKRNQALETKIIEVERAYEELEEAENQLLHSERLAAMGQLAASIVHELNSPLTIIAGYLELLLLRCQLDDQERKMITISQQQAESMRLLVSQILSFSHKQSTPFDVIDLNQLVDHIIGFFSSIQRHMAFEIVKTLSPDLPALRASAQQLQQVCINLITNAADAMDEQGTLVIETATIESARIQQLLADPDYFSVRSLSETQTLINPERRHVMLRMTDTGPGIPETSLRQIFNPFFTTKSEGKGTGLGLSICRTIIERHDGNIFVKSPPGGGTTFLILLPVHRD